MLQRGAHAWGLGAGGVGEQGCTLLLHVTLRPKFASILTRTHHGMKLIHVRPALLLYSNAAVMHAAAGACVCDVHWPLPAESS